MCWDGIDKSEEAPGEEKKFLNCFMVLSNEVIKLNSNLDWPFDQFDMSSFDELSHVLNELYNDMTSLFMKNKALELKLLSKQITLKEKDKKSKISEENFKRKIKVSKQKVINLSARILQFTIGKKLLNFLLGQQKQTINKHGI